MHGQGCKGTSGQTVNGEPLSLYRWKWCLCIDLDERVADSQFSRVDSQTMTTGGSQKIPEVQIFAKSAYGALQIDHSQPFVGTSMKSEKLIGFGALHFDLLELKVSVCTSTGHP